jgi:hypothetical protein
VMTLVGGAIVLTGVLIAATAPSRAAAV